MTIDFRYRCTECGKEYVRDEVRYLCPACSKAYAPGIPLRGVLSVEFDYDALRRRFDRGAPDWSLFSAVDPQYFPAYPVGNTPYVRALRLGAAIGCGDLWIKNDGQNPSGSLKDRASFLVAAEAIRLKCPSIVAASTGNAASALAAVCASAGMKAIIFVPETAPKAKLVQMVLYGATVVPVRGTYDDAFALSIRYTEAKGGLNRNTAYHPLTIEGKKTAGLEIWAQNGFKVPETIVIPVGDGVILAGVYKAFYDLRQSGLIDSIPRLVCVQAESSAAIHHYVMTGSYAPAHAPRTIADSISVSVPSNAHQARRAILESGGCSVTVSDAESVEAQRALASLTGVFAEPAASAAVAGAKKLAAAGDPRMSGRVVLLITGHGLKDIDVPLRTLKIPAAIDPAEQTFDGI